MARAPRKKKTISWRWRLLALLLLAVIGVGGWQWWQAIHWTPSQQNFPDQGVLIGAGDGEANFRGFAAVGARFAYLEASIGADRRDPSFADNFARITNSGLQYGVVHIYDPCDPAEKQAANFVTTVPRDPELLPPAVALDKTAEDCDPRVSDAAVESELTTFLNQLEGHAGKPAILMVSESFERRYRIASRIDRNLWLERDWFLPDYAGRPWMLWTANSQLRSEASETPLRWVVVQP